MNVSSVSMAVLEDEFDQAEQTVLSSYADALSGGSELMMTMPALADAGVFRSSHASQINRFTQDLCQPSFTFAEYGDNLRQELRSRDQVTDESKTEMLNQIDEFRKKSKMQIPDIERTIIKLAEQPQEAGLWARLLQRVAGWGLGVAQVRSCLALPAPGCKPCPLSSPATPTLVPLSANVLQAIMLIKQSCCMYCLEAFTRPCRAVGLRSHLGSNLITGAPSLWQTAHACTS